jgi:hypothetical protein
MLVAGLAIIAEIDSSGSGAGRSWKVMRLTNL